MTRIIDLEGGCNFRDLGGYRTHDGRELKWGRVFRTGGSCSGGTIARWPARRGRRWRAGICSIRSRAAPGRRYRAPSWSSKKCRNATRMELIAHFKCWRVFGLHLAPIVDARGGDVGLPKPFLGDIGDDPGHWWRPWRERCSLDSSHVLLRPLKGEITDVNPALERAVHIGDGQHHERNQQGEGEDLQDMQSPVARTEHRDGDDS